MIVLVLFQGLTHPGYVMPPPPGAENQDPGLQDLSVRHRRGRGFPGLGIYRSLVLDRPGL